MGPRSTCVPVPGVATGPVLGLVDPPTVAEGPTTTALPLLTGEVMSPTVGTAVGFAARHSATSAGVIGSEADQGRPPVFVADAFHAALAAAARISFDIGFANSVAGIFVAADDGGVFLTSPLVVVVGIE